MTNQNKKFLLAMEYKIRLFQKQQAEAELEIANLRLRQAELELKELD